MLGLTTLTLAVPLAGAVAVSRMGAERPRMARWLASLLIATAMILTALGLLHPLAPDEIAWLPSWGVRFGLGIDGLSGLSLLVIGAVSLARVLGAWEADATSRWDSGCALAAMAAAGLAATATDALGWVVGLTLWLGVELIERSGAPSPADHLAASRLLWTAGAGLAPIAAVVLLTGTLAGGTSLAGFWQNHPIAVAPMPTQLLVLAVLLLGLAPWLPVFPLQGAYLAASERPWGLGWLALAPMLTLEALLRVGFLVMPSPAQQGHGVLQAVAVLGMLYAAWGAWGALTPRRRLACAGMMLASLDLFTLAAFDFGALRLGLAALVSHALWLGWMGLVQEREAGPSLADRWLGGWGPVGAALLLGVLTAWQARSVAPVVAGVAIAVHAWLLLVAARRLRGSSPEPGASIAWPSAVFLVLLLVVWVPAAGGRWLGEIAVQMRPFLGL